MCAGEGRGVILKCEVERGGSGPPLCSYEESHNGGVIIGQEVGYNSFHVG